MNENVVIAAKWFSGGLVSASLVLVCGGYFIVSDSTDRLSRALVQAGERARSVHSSGGGGGHVFQNQLQLAPVEVHVKQIK